MAKVDGVGKGQEAAAVAKNQKKKNEEKTSLPGEKEQGEPVVAETVKDSVNLSKSSIIEKAKKRAEARAEARAAKAKEKPSEEVKAAPTESTKSRRASLLEAKKLASESIAKGQKFDLEKNRNSNISKKAKRKNFAAAAGSLKSRLSSSFLARNNNDTKSKLFGTGFSRF